MLNYKVKPWEHQREAIETASLRDEYALFFEMGTGKTATAINILRKWSAKEGRLLNTLILCPPIVVDQWEKEILAHSNIGCHQIVKLQGSGAKRLKALKAAPKNSIIITNYETLSMNPVFAEFLSRGVECLICDESHKLKSITARRTKLVTLLSEKTRKRLILTGSPILNTLMDIFSQYQIMDRGETFGKNFFVFRSRYFFDRNSGMPKHRHFPDWQPRHGSHDEINKLIYTKAMHVEKSRCLDLPPLIRKTLYVDMSPEQARAYKEMKEDLVTYLDDSAAVAQLAITKLLRLQQIVSGFVKTDKDDTFDFKSVPRLAVLSDLLEELTPQHKVIVWAGFKHNYHAIGKMLQEMKIGYVELHGECSEKQKKEAVERFRIDPNCRVIVANPKAGGVGLNLIEASYSIYYSRGYSLEDDLQSEARNYRGGSEMHSKVTRIDLVAKGTVDELIMEALANKQDISKKILAIKDQLRLV